MKRTFRLTAATGIGGPPVHGARLIQVQGDRAFDEVRLAQTKASAIEFTPVPFVLSPSTHFQGPLR